MGCRLLDKGEKEMKYILILMLTVGYSQDSSNTWITAKEDRIEIVRLETTYNLIMINPAGKELWLDFGGVTLKVYGDLELDSAAMLFIDWVQTKLWEYECGKLNEKETQ